MVDAFLLEGNNPDLISISSSVIFLFCYKSVIHLSGKWLLWTNECRKSSAQDDRMILACNLLDGMMAWLLCFFCYRYYCGFRNSSRAGDSINSSGCGNECEISYRTLKKGRKRSSICGRECSWSWLDLGCLYGLINTPFSCTKVDAARPAARYPCCSSWERNNSSTTNGKHYLQNLLSCCLELFHDQNPSSKSRHRIIWSNGHVIETFLATRTK